MGTHDQYVAQQAQSHLAPGESILMHGRVSSKRPHNDTYDEWFVAVTEHRLLFFPMKQTMTMALKPSDLCDPWQVRFKDLKKAWFKEGIGVSNWVRIGMESLKGRGPLDLQGNPASGNYYIPVHPSFDNRVVFDIPDSTKEMESQPQFRQQFGPWFQKQVGSREHWGAEEQAILEAEAAEAAAKEAKRAEQKASALEYAPIAVSIVGVLIALSSIAFFVNASSASGRIENAEKNIACADQSIKAYEANRGWLKKGKKPPKDCPFEKISSEQNDEQCAADVRIDSFGAYCHLCRITSKKPIGHKARGKNVFERDGSFWACPKDEGAIDRKVERLKKHQGEHQAEIDEQNTRALVNGVLGAGAVLLGLVLIGGGLFLRMRARKAST